MNWATLRKIQNVRLLEQRYRQASADMGEIKRDAKESKAGECLLEPEQIAHLVDLARATMPGELFGMPGAPIPSEEDFWCAVDSAVSADQHEQEARARALGAELERDTDAAEWIAQFVPRGSEGVEVGVWRGRFSRMLLDGVAPRRLHLVDPWEFQPAFPLRLFGGKSKRAKQQQDMDTIYESVRSMFAGNPAVEFHRKTSSDAFEEFEDESLDWVFVDGNHHYEWVKVDLRGWWAKLKPGALLLGDDFMWGGEYGWPVRRAVLEFVAEGFVDFVAAERKYYVLRKKAMQLCTSLPCNE